ncbi:hypothetical protein A7U60_g8647 [Sanghuangporus baumii]|uniref:4Fe-4S ferredoxin-type domain-containing protein n=1 Tax=Sanghuangporus baumii TaxID=108892 RepID=A0A9Q5HQA5_SANBA|nr:hypothetical protein A7U60_g8647 [Sanghuangporus baumii]
MKVTNSDARPQKPAKKKPGRAPNPCENCTKRGCAVICPDGTLTTGRHNRMILSNTEELHDKIDSLLERIRILEDALKTLQASVSSEPHPLLTAPTTDSILSTIHVYPVRDDRAAHRPSTAEDEEDILDSFGTLSVGSDGETSYLGQTARADYLIDDSDSDDDIEIGRLPRSFYSFSWPECPPPDNSIEEVVLSYLPDLNEAYALCDIYCSMSSWMGFLIPREAIREDFIAHVYHLPNRPWADTPLTCPHRLSLLFAIFCIGSLFDSSQKPNNVQADDYYHLARVALSFKSAVLETTTYAVLAIAQLAYILLLRDSHNAHEQGWVMLGVANKLAISMGLHKDSSRWHLDPEMTERRHTTYWQLYLIETMAFGKLARQAVSDIFEAKATSYSAILDVDSKVRSIADLDWQEFVREGQDIATTEKIRWNVNHCKESSAGRFYSKRSTRIHRIRPWASMDVQYKLASKVPIDLSKAWFGSQNRYVRFILPIGDFNLISGKQHACPNGSPDLVLVRKIVMCTIAAQCPTSEVARPALEKLDIIHTTLQKISNVNRTAEKNLVMTRQLRNLARTAFERTRLLSHNAAISLDNADVLSRGCGKTYMRTRKERPQGSANRRRRRNGRSSSTPEGPGGENWDERAAKSTLSVATSTASTSSHCGDGFSRFNVSGDSYSPSFGQGLDATWNTFIQQLGF